VHGLHFEFDTAEVMLGELPREFVVIARHIHNAATLASGAKNLLHHVVVRLRPIPALAQLPAVDDVAHKVEAIARMVLEEVQQRGGLATGCAKVNVGNPHSAHVARGRMIRVVGPTGCDAGIQGGNEGIEGGQHDQAEKCFR